jgi:hypothetical protein
MGRSGEAIEWMGRKRQQLSALEVPDPHHEYTLLANLGTFHAHRWLRAEKAVRDRVDLERARDLITSAIEKNPDAHFGRERYQLLAIESLLDPVEPVSTDSPATLVPRMFAKQGFKYRGAKLEEIGYGDAVEGLSGLIHLGDAWRSTLIWATLEEVLRLRRDAYLARLAAFRVVEILDADREALPEFNRVNYLGDTRALIETPDGERLDAWQSKARGSVLLWQASRTRYVMERLDRGEHPDTHSQFWSEWRDEHPLPDLGSSLSADERRRYFQAARMAAVVIAGACCIVLIRRRRKRLAAAA